MKKVFGLITALLLFANLACGLKTETQEAQGEVRIQIPVREGDQAQLKVVTLKNIADLRRLSGGIAHFYYAPRIVGHQIIGEVPLARFVKGSNGVFIPANSSSAEMASIYYHLQNLAEYDQAVGLADVNQWPRRVAMSTRIMQNQGFVTNNSFYDQGSDSMIFVDFQSPDLSLALNPGVIAHEHFHSIFSKLVLIPLVQAGKMEENLRVYSHGSPFFAKLLGAPEIAPRLSTTGRRDFEKSLKDFVLFKALNEGLADFWGWVYSKDDNYVGRSIPKEKTRSLEKPAEGFDTPEGRAKKLKGLSTIYENAENKPKVLSEIQELGGVYAYALGNQYARFFRSLTRTSDGGELSATERDDVVRRIIELLHQVREGILTEDNKEIVEPEVFLKKFADNNPDVLSKHCEKFQKISIETFDCGVQEHP